MKTIVEDIKWALATNDLDKVKLLSEQATERIAETSIRIEKGKGNLTPGTLEKSDRRLRKAR